MSIGISKYANPVAMLNRELWYTRAKTFSLLEYSQIHTHSVTTYTYMAYPMQPAAEVSYDQ